MAFGIGFDEPTGECHAHPCDPRGLNRCLRLLAAEPEMRPLLGKVASVLPVWAALIGQWQSSLGCT